MKKSIGIEVGANFIRAIVVNKVRGKIKVIKSLKETWNWKDNDKLPDSLKKILIKGRPAVYLSLPKSITFFRKASFPFKNRKKILLTLPYEVEGTLPLPIDQLNFDFYKIRREKNKTEVIAVAISKEMAEKVITPFEKIGVKVSSLESAAIPLFNLYSISSEKKRNLLILYLSEDETLLDVVQNGSLVDSRSIKYRDALSKEIFYIEKAFFSREALEEILLIGSSDLEDELREKLKTPIIKLNLSKISKVSGTFNSEFSLALGLSLKRFIRPPLSLDLRTKKRKMKPFPQKRNILISSLILIFLFLFFFPFFNLKKKQTEYRLLKKEINETYKDIFPLLGGKSVPLKELKRRLGLKDEGLEKVALLLDKKISPLETLKRVSAIIPRDLKIEVKSIAMDRNGLTIFANLSSLKEIDQLKKILQKDAYFEQIRIGDTRLNKEKGNIEFSLNLKIK